MRLFCESERLSLCVRGHSFRRDDTDFVVFCFAKAPARRTIPSALRRRIHGSEGSAEVAGALDNSEMRRDNRHATTPVR
jgi:hypothetical protein